MNVGGVGVDLRLPLVPFRAAEVGGLARLQLGLLFALERPGFARFGPLLALTSLIPQLILVHRP